MPGSYTYINGTLSVQVMTHEVGHNFGLGHANARNCVVGGTRVTIAADASCTTQTYADPFSTMGNNALRHNHGSQLGELGWLDASQKVVGTPGNTYTISPYFGTGTVKLVRIPRGNGSFFDLDFRMTYGSFDNFAAGSPAVSGVDDPARLGHGEPDGLAPGHRAPRHHAATTDLKDAPLLVGRSITDPVSRSRSRPSRSAAAASASGSPRASRRARPDSLVATAGQRAEREPRLECRERQRRDRLATG